MSSEPHNDRLLDLLYGELDPDEETALREELQDDDALAAELRELTEARQEISDHIPAPEPVPTALTESILAAARAEADTRKPAAASNGRRPNRGVWTTLASANLYKLGSYAAVLIATGAVLTILFGESVFQDAEQEVGRVAIQTGHSGSFSSGPGRGSSEPEIVAHATPPMPDEEAESIEDSLAMELELSPAPQPSTDVEAAPQTREIARVETRRSQQEPRARRAAPRTAAPRPAAPQQQSQQDSPTRGGAFADPGFGRIGSGGGGGAATGMSAPAPEALAADSTLEEAAVASLDLADEGAEVTAEADEAEEETDEESLLDQAQRALEDGEVGHAARLLEQILADDDHSEEYQERADSLRRSIEARQARRAAASAPAEAEAEDADISAEPESILMEGLID